ncbi:SCO family protein [bacterium SCSIO 12741]|nr:SCO family protein [bacterium SCSIO 12741]
MKWSSLLFALIPFFAACDLGGDEPLPILGRHLYETKMENGIPSIDTIYYKLPDFELDGHRGSTISQSDLKGKVYVADFFFTSCPSICPIMSKNMLALSETFKGNDQVAFLSVSIDPIHDSVPTLKKYSEKLQVQNPNWHFVTGEKDGIFDLAEAYMVSAMEDSRAPGGYAHSGAFILVDAEGHIRAYYDGTKDEDIPEVERDIKRLLK